MLINHHGSTYIERMYMAGGQYERDHLPDGSWRNLTYITTPAGLSAVFIQNEGSQEEEFYFIHTDYHGSIMALTDYNGQLLEEYSCDPWGNRRYPETWENMYTNTTNPTAGQSGSQSLLWGVGGALFRGYTFHEHLDCFALINMNGRMYDPVLGRMLSPDNYTHSGTQGLNRYSYVFNNPLKYTDPSGEVPWLIPLALGVTSAYLGGASANDWNLNPVQWDWNAKTFSGIVAGGLIGVSLGVSISIAAGQGALAGNLSKAAQKAIVGGNTSGFINMLSNYDNKAGIGWHSLAYFASGFAGGAAGAEFGMIGGMSIGGFANGLTGIALRNAEEFSAYTFWQDVVGGALSTYAGLTYAKKFAGEKGKYFFGESKFGKDAQKFLSYGLQSTAVDFAYTD
jgi:RHS repeat-associated protein